MNFVLSGELYTKLLTYLFTKEGVEELVDGLKALPRANVVSTDAPAEQVAQPESEVSSENVQSEETQGGEQTSTEETGGSENQSQE